MEQDPRRIHSWKSTISFVSERSSLDTMYYLYSDYIAVELELYNKGRKSPLRKLDSIRKTSSKEPGLLLLKVM